MTDDVIKVQEDTRADNEENKWCVYIHTNLINGKKYIGITSYKPEHRWKADGRGYEKQSRFWNAIQKYGWNNFEHKIILANINYNDACDAEQYLIKYYRTMDENCGYNLTEGGKGTFGIRRFGQDNPNYGNHKLAGENNPSYGKHYRCTPVYSIELNRIFFGSRDAERCTGADHSAIIKCCKQKIQRTCGTSKITGEPLHWLYVYDQEQKDGTVIQGAITLGHITEKEVNNYLNSLKQKGND